MIGFPYLPNPARLVSFLDKLHEVGIPDKATTRWLPSVGFKATNDRAVLRVLKSLGFASPDGTPTEVWKTYRDRKRAPTVLAGAIRTAYTSLFATYPDAQRKDDEALRDFFRSHSDVAGGVLTLIVRTFKQLCEKADFETRVEEPVPTRAEPRAKPTVSPPSAVGAPDRGVTINLRIELALPSSEDGRVYDKFFEALKKHLLS